MSALDNYTTIIIDSATPPVTEIFTSTDQSYNERETGTSLDWCELEWHVIDEVNLGPYTHFPPSDSFQKLFQQNSKVFCMHKEAGWRTVLDNLFRDVLSRKEFSSVLLVFPEYEFCVPTIMDSRPIRHSGKADYTIRHSACKNVLEKELSQELELYLIAAVAKRDWLEESYWHCMAQTAALEKSLKDANKKRRQVWGVLSNATSGGSSS